MVVLSIAPRWMPIASGDVWLLSIVPRSMSVCALLLLTGESSVGVAVEEFSGAKIVLVVEAVETVLKGLDPRLALEVRSRREGLSLSMDVVMSIVCFWSAGNEWD